MILLSTCTHIPYRDMSIKASFQPRSARQCELGEPLRLISKNCKEDQF